jgi:hypothetical protein
MLFALQGEQVLLNWTEEMANGGKPPSLFPDIPGKNGEGGVCHCLSFQIEMVVVS